MSETEASNGQSAAALLKSELAEFRKSNSLSKEGLREIIERHGLNPNNDSIIKDFFFWACRIKRVDEEIIHCLLEYFPTAASATNSIGQTPLHAACYRANVSLGVVKLLIDAAPDSVLRIDDDGWMPLHYLCDNDKIGDEISAVNILKLFIEKHPEVVRHADNEGDLPIHYAAGFRSPEFCQLLIEAYPGSERINASNDILPLHWACHYNTVATVQYLYNLYPDAVNLATITPGDYPIHCAIFTGLRKRANPKDAIEIVQYLLDCDPNVKLQKWEGMSLLHYACEKQALGKKSIDSSFDPALVMIKTIYDAYPEAIEDDRIVSETEEFEQQVQAFINSELVYARQARDPHFMNTLRFPLHRSLQNIVRSGSIKLLMKGNPSALRALDNNFAMPLHIACEHHDSTSVVQCLLDLDMTTLRAMDVDNNTALHYACRGAKYETINMLLERYDAISVSKRNSHNKLPVDLLWESSAVEDRESIEYTESVFRLLREYPEMIMTR